MSTAERCARAVGVFDSGIGGLTVLRALRAALPDESFVYLGDTARLPYGTKTSATVERYALQAAELLVARDIKCLVIACNTASAAALPAIQARFSSLPVIGVVEPGAAAAVVATRNDRIAVLATEGTVRGGAYQNAIARRRPAIQVTAIAAQLFVALAEEGWTDGDIALAIARRYLDPVFATTSAQRPDTLVLGCTHFPLLEQSLRVVVGPGVQIVDSAATTAEVCRVRLEQDDLLFAGDAPGVLKMLVTDGERRFAASGAAFLGASISPEMVERVDL